MSSKMDKECLLHEWAHVGDEESIKKLKEFIAQEKDEYLLGQAKCALDEAYYNYYSGDEDDEQSEKDFLLAKLILEKEEEIIKVMGKIEAGKLELEKSKLDNLIGKKIIKDLKNPMWFNFIPSHDYSSVIENRTQELEEEMDYLEKWIEHARKEIKIEKYKTIPREILNCIHLDGEGDSCWEDD